MHHRKRDRKLGRSGSHREALVASLVSNLLLRKRIKTTLPKAQEARRLAEKVVTIAKGGSVSARRTVLALIREPGAVSVLFKDVAPQFTTRPGGYTRIVKLGEYKVGDGSELVFLEWVGIAVPAPQQKKKQAPEKKAAA